MTCVYKEYEVTGAMTTAKAIVSCNVVHCDGLVLMWGGYVACDNYYLLCFHILYSAYKWGCKQVNRNKNSFLSAPSEP